MGIPWTTRQPKPYRTLRHSLPALTCPSALPLPCPHLILLFFDARQNLNLGCLETKKARG